MVELIEETIINTQPEEVWEFLSRLDKGERYKQWHPRDHVCYKVIKGAADQAGSIVFFDEYIGKRRLRLFCQVTRAIPPSYMEYAAAFPLSLLKMGKGYFKIESVEPNCTKLTAFIAYGYSLPIVGKILDWIIEWYVHKRDIERHMREEGANIKNVLESSKLVMYDSVLSSEAH